MNRTPFEKQEISKEILFREIDCYFKLWANKLKDTIQEEIDNRLAETPDKDTVNVFDCNVAVAKYSGSPAFHNPLVACNGVVCIDYNRLMWLTFDKIEALDAEKKKK